MFDSGGLIVGKIVIIILLFGDQSRIYKDVNLNFDAATGGRITRDLIATSLKIFLFDVSCVPDR